MTVRSFTESNMIPQSGQCEAFGSTVITYRAQRLRVLQQGRGQAYQPVDDIHAAPWLPGPTPDLLGYLQVHADRSFVRSPQAFPSEKVVSGWHARGTLAIVLSSTTGAGHHGDLDWRDWTCDGRWIYPFAQCEQ